MSYFIKQSTATKPLLFLMILSSDHISPATGLTPTVTLSKAGATFASPAGAVTEIANGWYQVASNATDSNTLGPLILHATGTAADPTDIIYRIVAFDPDSATNLGLSGLPTASPAASGGIPTVGTGSGQVNPDGSGSVPLAFGTVLPTNPVANTVGEALFFADILGGRVNTAQGGTSTTITLDASASSDANAYVGDDIYLYGGTGGGSRGSGQRRTVVAYNTSTKVVTVNRAWTTTPDNTTKFMTLPQPQANVGIWNNAAVGVSLPSSGTLSTLAGGAQMDLVNAPNATAVTAIQSGLATASVQTAVKAKTDLIATNSADSPNAVTAQGTISTNLNATVSSRAATGAQMDLVNAPNATAVTAIQSGLATASVQTAVKAKTDLIATNTADSPNAVTAQSTISTNLNTTVGSRSTYAGGAVASVTGPVTLDMTQTVPTSNTAQTVGDAFNAARAQGFGKWVISGTTLTLYANDGTTAVKVFTLDSASSPTRRS